MSKPFISKLRLKHKDYMQIGKQISFNWNGKSFDAISGETVAAALSANGITKMRYSRDENAHGQFCGMGICHECLVNIDGRLAQKACMTELTNGMNISSHHHDRFDGELKAKGETQENTDPIETFDCLIVGAGPAGLAAAVTCNKNGLSVAICDERDDLGGQYYKGLAKTHAFSNAPSDQQFIERGALVSQVEAAKNVNVFLKTTIWQIIKSQQGFEVSTLNNGIYKIFKAKNVILAQGAYEQPHHVPGWTLDGVMTTGAAQTLARRYRVAAGQRVLIAGNGPLNIQLAYELTKGGADVVGVIESANYTALSKIGSLMGAFYHAPKLIIQGLKYRYHLARAKVPIFQGTQLEKIIAVDDKRVVTLKTKKNHGEAKLFEMEAEVICLGYGFISNTDLARQLGVKTIKDEKSNFPKPIIGDMGETNIPSLFIAGDCAGIGGAIAAQQEGVLAAIAASKNLNKKHEDADLTQALSAKRSAEKFQHHLWDLFSPSQSAPALTKETILCRCEEVSFEAVEKAIENGTYDAGAVKRKTRLGMGRCQGRYCSGILDSILAKRFPDNINHQFGFMPQIPAKPISCGAIAKQKPEWAGHKEVSIEKNLASEQDEQSIPKKTEILVIGGGIIGVSTALELSRLGHQVVLIEKGTINSQASGGNAGSLHVQLLSYDYGDRAQHGGNPALQTLPLQREGVERWKHIESELNSDFEITQKGGLILAETQQDLDYLKAKIKAEKAMGIDVEVIDKNELKSLSPNVSDEFIGGAYCPMEGKINPLITTPILANTIKILGSKIEENTCVLGIEEQTNGTYKVSTSRGDILANKIVIAAGGWSAQIAAMVNIDVPVKGAPLQMIVTEPGPKIVDQLIAHASRHLTLKQATNGNLIIGGGWWATYNAIQKRTQVDTDSLEGNLWVACHCVPAIKAFDVIRTWAAMNVNVDGAPLVDHLPGHKNIWIVASANGYTLGPILGLLLAETICGKNKKQLKPFSFDRFNNN